MKGGGGNDPAHHNRFCVLPPAVGDWRLPMKVYFIVFFVLSAISFFITAGLYWVVCWSFHWTFMWRYAIGIYAIEWFLSLTLNSKRKD